MESMFFSKSSLRNCDNAFRLTIDISLFLLYFLPVHGSRDDVFMHSFSIFLFLHHVSLFLMRKICTIICNRCFIMISGLLVLVVLLFELRTSCLIGRHFLTWATPPALWFLKCSSFIFPRFSVYTGIWYPCYILLVAPRRLHTGKIMNA
jgi:hypothetical protein